MSSAAKLPLDPINAVVLALARATGVMVSKQVATTVAAELAPFGFGTLQPLHPFQVLAHVPRRRDGDVERELLLVAADTVLDLARRACTVGSCGGEPPVGGERNRPRRCEECPLDQVDHLDRLVRQARCG